MPKVENPFPVGTAVRLTNPNSAHFDQRAVVDKTYGPNRRTGGQLILVVKVASGSTFGVMLDSVEKWEDRNDARVAAKAFLNSSGGLI